MMPAKQTQISDAIRLPKNAALPGVACSSSHSSAFAATAHD